METGSTKLAFTDNELAKSNLTNGFQENNLNNQPAGVEIAFTKLADFPYTGKQGRVFGTRELVITNTHYNAVFRILPDCVEIVSLIHQAQDWGNADT